MFFAILAPPFFPNFWFSFNAQPASSEKSLSTLFQSFFIFLCINIIEIVNEVIIYLRKVDLHLYISIADYFFGYRCFYASIE
jgi:hypothetical protein